MLWCWHSWIIWDGLYYWWKAELCCLVQKRSWEIFLVSYLDRSSTNVGLYPRYIEVCSLHCAIALETIAVRGIPGGSWLGCLCWKAGVEAGQTLFSGGGRAKSSPGIYFTKSYLFAHMSISSLMADGPSKPWGKRPCLFILSLLTVSFRSNQLASDVPE